MSTEMVYVLLGVVGGLLLGLGLGINIGRWLS